MFRGRKVFAIILAGGESKRFGSRLPKQFLKIGNKTVLGLSIEAFERHRLVDGIVVVFNPRYRGFVNKILLEGKYSKVLKVLEGGKTRTESSKIGVLSIDDEESLVLIHDAARPFVREEIITRVVECLDIYESVGVAIPSTDTVVLVSDGVISEVLERKKVMLQQTPQGFRTKVIKRAFSIYERNPVETTDDCTLVVRYNLGRVGIVEGDRVNIKITYPEDLFVAKEIFKKVFCRR